MFPGFGTGVSLILTKALPQIKQVTQQVGSSYEAWRINAEALNMPISKIAEATQLTHNIWMQFIDSILRSSSAVAFIETLLDVIKGVQSALSWLEQKVPVVFNIIFVGGLIAAGAVVVNLTKKLFAQIGAVLSLSASLKELNKTLLATAGNMGIVAGAQSMLNVTTTGGTATNLINAGSRFMFNKGTGIYTPVGVEHVAAPTGLASIGSKIAAGVSKMIGPLAIIAGSVYLVQSIDNHIKKIRADQMRQYSNIVQQTMQYPNIQTASDKTQYSASLIRMEEEARKQYPRVWKELESDYDITVTVNKKPRNTYRKAVNP
jgi:hypothetical protein